MICEGLMPLCTPQSGGCAPTAPERRALRPSTPGDFLPDEKVTKESPGAAPLGTRWCEISALFALAALRSGSRRAGFCHRKRPICHFEFVGKPVFVVSFGFIEERFFLLIRGAGVLVARLGATFGGIRGIGEGDFCAGRGFILQRSQGNEVWFDWCKTKSDAIE